MIKVWEGLGGIPTVIQYPFTAKRAPLRVAYALRRAIRMRIRSHPAYTYTYTHYVVLLCRNCNLRIRPTDPGVATLSDFESVGPDRPTRCAERGGGILGRNDCFLAVSGGFERFQAVLDRHSPTDRPRSEKG